MEQKYELTEEIMEYGEFTLHRIKALRDFGNVKKGDLGGWIEKESNLSHKGISWVSDNARVFDNARVGNNAQVCDNARVGNNARVYDNARVYNNAQVFGTAEVHDNARVFDNASISDNARVYNNAQVFGNAEVKDIASIADNACVYGSAHVYGYACVYGSAHVYGDIHVGDKAWISLTGDISSTGDYIYFTGMVVESLHLTAFKCSDNQICVSYGVAKGALSTFINTVTKHYDLDQKGMKELLMILDLVKLHFDV